LRPAFFALWNLDLAFADVVSTSSDPRLGAIRMAWWRERLDELDRSGEPPAEPRLRAVAAELLPRGIGGRELSQLEDAWLPLLEPFPWGATQGEALKLRGRILFGMGARLLGAGAEDAEQAGALWSLVDGAEHCTDPASKTFMLVEAANAAAQLPSKACAALRPLTLLAALAAHDLTGPRGQFGRGSAALKHRFTGRFPR
jgi:phytoene synthase